MKQSLRDVNKHERLILLCMYIYIPIYKLVYAYLTELMTYKFIFF